MRETRDIAGAYVVKAQVDKEERAGVQTEGVNFAAIWECAESFPVDVNNMRSNDTWRVLQTYGVEAARKNIVLEINAVFGAYGYVQQPHPLISISRHLVRCSS